MATSQLPQRARRLIFATFFAGIAAAAFRVPDVLRWSLRDVVAFAAMAAAIALAEQFTAKIRYGNETWNFSLTDAVAAAGLLLVRPSALALAVGAGILVGHSLGHLNRYKLAFNVGQFLVAISAAQVVHSLIPHDGVLDPQSWLAVTAAMTVFSVVNACSVGLIISIVEEKSFGSVFLPPLVLNVVHYAGNLAIGILGAVLWAGHPFAVPLLIVPLVLSYFAYQAYAQGMRERDRMRYLYEAGRSLFNPLSEKDDFRGFVRSVQEMLEAPAAEVVLVNDGRVTVHDESGTVSLTPSVEGNGQGNGHHASAPEAFMRFRPGLVPNTALVGRQDGTHGVLAVYRSDDLTSAERSLLDALASQFSVWLQNVRLFSETSEQRTQLEEIIGHTSDGIFVVSPDCVILSWNPAMEQITGFASDEAVGRACEEILGTDCVPRVGAGLGELNGDGVDARLVTKDRRARWIRYSTNPILDRDGELKASVVVARDVTRELEAEELKADFVATVSHELRTPLTPLKGFLAALLQGTVEDSPQARQEYYRIMLNQANRLERLITDLLEVSRMESGKPRMHSDAVEVISLVAEQIQEFAESDPGREINLRGPRGPLYVMGDRFRLGQVIGNLLSNALKYSPPESSVDVVVEMADGQAVVSVVDRGDGIPLSEHERVFDRFHRLENGLTRQTGGTGLGLYIARRLIEAMSGRLWLVSRPGAGSTFSFSLPIVSEQEVANAAVAAAAAMEG
ncbi:MAG TPA: ATP-binding protein [Actinomycetota bacterium]|nr:ATP-binding protein [Actinomycetota bacterium]